MDIETIEQLKTEYKSLLKKEENLKGEIAQSESELSRTRHEKRETKKEIDKIIMG